MNLCHYQIARCVFEPLIQAAFTSQQFVGSAVKILKKIQTYRRETLFLGCFQYPVAIGSEQFTSKQCQPKNSTTHRRPTCFPGAEEGLKQLPHDSLASSQNSAE